MKGTTKKKPHPMEIHKSLERIKETKLADMGLFELSIHSLMPSDVFGELRNRLMLAQASLKVGDARAAKVIIDGLLAGPQKRRIV
jgi:hypothetical protein